MRLIDAGYVMKAINRHLKHPPVGRYEDGFNDGLNTAILEIMAALSQTNEPLTLDELRKMDGQPVWIKQLKDLSVCDTGWALIDICPDREEKLYDIRVWWPGSEVEDEPSEEDYGNTWVAYGHPPERQEDK